MWRIEGTLTYDNMKHTTVNFFTLFFDFDIMPSLMLCNVQILCIFIYVLHDSHTHKNVLMKTHAHMYAYTIPVYIRLFLSLFLSFFGAYVVFSLSFSPIFVYLFQLPLYRSILIFTKIQNRNRPKQSGESLKSKQFRLFILVHVIVFRQCILYIQLTGIENKRVQLAIYILYCPV